MRHISKHLPATVDVGFGVAPGPFRAEASFRLPKNEHYQVLNLGLDQDLTLGQDLLGPLFVGQNQGPFQVWDHALTEDLLLEEGPSDQSLPLLEKHPLGAVDLAGDQAYGAQASQVLGDQDAGLSSAVDLLWDTKLK